MVIKKSLFLLFFIILSSSSFSQNNNLSNTDTSYLESVKKSFVQNSLPDRVDSLWIDKLVGLDLYKNIDNDIKTINLDEKVDYDLSTALLKQRLAEMDAKSPFKIQYNEGLENLIKTFLKKRKKDFARLLAISEFYFPRFEEEFDRQNIPLELKYLSIVESTMNPRATSRVGASGIWQFMYQTGRQYDLSVDSYVDQRRDPSKSTIAAASYMKDLYNILNDWDLVLAAYNSGPGNVSKAIRRAGGKTSYWEIRKFLPKETQGYVPAFLATMYIFEYHKEHGIIPETNNLGKFFSTDTIQIKKEITFKQISDLLDIPVVELQMLNPSYKLDVIPSYKNNKNYVRLPLDKIATFTSNESKIYAYSEYINENYKNPLQRKYGKPNGNSVAVVQTKYHKTKNGDNLGSIAQKYNVTVANIKKWNRLRNNRLASGQKLKIITKEYIAVATKTTPKIQPSKTIEKPEIKLATNTANKDQPKEKSTDFYVVQKGDNLGSIAKANNTSVAKLTELNHLGNSETKPTTVSQTTKNITEPEATETKNNTYNTGAIAQNDSQNEDTSIIEYGKDSAPEYYNVQKKDTLWSISKKYPGVSIADLKKWNNLDDSSDLQPGMLLKIRG